MFHFTLFHVIAMSLNRKMTSLSVFFLSGLFASFFPFFGCFQLTLPAEGGSPGWCDSVDQNHRLMAVCRDVRPLVAQLLLIFIRSLAELEAKQSDKSIRCLHVYLFIFVEENQLRLLFVYSCQI